ncbi:unnamed protein product, partial [Meganyctiphanes norvegica]
MSSGLIVISEPSKMMLAIVLACALLGVVTPHSIGLGSCPKIPAATNFQTEQFLGTWYVIEIFGRQTKCMTLTFNEVSNSSLSVTEGMEFYLLDKVNVDYAHSNTGTLKIEDPANSAQMRVKWPDNILGSATFTVVDTDYEGYALIVECQKLWLASRTNAAILSREPTLAPELITKLKGTVDSMDLDSTDFSSMRHDNCIPDGQADFDFAFDESIRKNTFGFLEEEKVQTILTEEDLAAAIDFPIHCYILA